MDSRVVLGLIIMAFVHLVAWLFGTELFSRTFNYGITLVLSVNFAVFAFVDKKSADDFLDIFLREKE